MWSKESSWRTTWKQNWFWLRTRATKNKRLVENEKGLIERVSNLKIKIHLSLLIHCFIHPVVHPAAWWRCTTAWWEGIWRCTTAWWDSIAWVWPLCRRASIAFTSTGGASWILCQKAFGRFGRWWCGDGWSFAFTWWSCGWSFRRSSVSSTIVSSARGVWRWRIWWRSWRWRRWWRCRWWRWRWRGTTFTTTTASTTTSTTSSADNADASTTAASTSWMAWPGLFHSLSFWPTVCFMSLVQKLYSIILIHSALCKYIATSQHIHCQFRWEWSDGAARMAASPHYRCKAFYSAATIQTVAVVAARWRVAVLCWNFKKLSMCVCFEFIPFDMVLPFFSRGDLCYSVMPHAMASSQHLRSSTTASSAGRATPWTSLAETTPCHDDDRVVIPGTAILGQHFRLYCWVWFYSSSRVQEEFIFLLQSVQSSEDIPWHQILQRYRKTSQRRNKSSPWGLEALWQSHSTLLYSFCFCHVSGWCWVGQSLDYFSCPTKPPMAFSRRLLLTCWLHSLTFSGTKSRSMRRPSVKRCIQLFKRWVRWQLWFTTRLSGGAIGPHKLAAWSVIHGWKIYLGIVFEYLIWWGQSHFKKKLMVEPRHHA